ncbi:hypothetical protein COY23_02665 [bacterium (Candidatus Torokbacteria) CG_4_10_14_0_2_um_filter_35_8]|nr:MAG: hypothetical protein COY23_02665 [bacterium (Candidatus Torokbacteria) CG_4_10_14_0_2_um_filter_35_8]
MIKITKELKKLIEENILAFATCDENKNPHCIAIGDVKVVSKNQVLIGDNYMVETIDNIQKNKNVALVVWNRNENIGYELKGKAEYFTNNKWHKMVQKIHKGFPAKGAILFTINKIKKLA